MKDIRHSPTPLDEALTSWACEDCRQPLPPLECLLVHGIGRELLEIPGGLGFIPDEGQPGTIPCNTPMAEKQREMAEALQDAQGITVTAAPLAAGETTKDAMPPSPMERMVNSAGFEGFLQMREATRLRDD